MLAAIRASRGRRLFVPETVQTSATDCGPATLKCVLEGFGVSVSYARLQEACQTDIDGTSIDTIEDIATKLGFDAEQIMLPLDHLLLPEAAALPAVVVTRNAQGFTHFVVVWSRHGPLVQVMDPATGRRWPRYDRFLEEIYIHAQPVPAAAWREWAATSEFQGALETRLAAFGVPSAMRVDLLQHALSDASWRGLATVDAATRLVTCLVRGDGIRPGQQAVRLLGAIIARTRHPHVPLDSVIPDQFWSVRAMGDDDAEHVVLRGAVLVRVRQRAAEKPEQSESPALSAEVVTALRQRSPTPLREVFRLLTVDGLLTPAALAFAAGLGAAGLIVQALMLRAFFDLDRVLGFGLERLAVIVALLIFGGLLLLLDFAVTAGMLRLGRRLDARLRMAFMAKIPRLGDRYFQSRLISDMAQRCHGLHALRMLPGLGLRLVHRLAELGLTAVAIAWLDPESAPLALLAVVFGVAVPLAAVPVLGERELRQRNHAAALSRFYLDALLGLVAIKTHRAEESVRRGHEAVLGLWARAGLGLQRAVMAIDGVQTIIGIALVTLLALRYLGRGGEPAAVLLLVYWALNLPMLAREVALLARQYPAYRNAVHRVLEPLGAPDDTEETGQDRDDIPTADLAASAARGVAIRFEEVTIRAAGRTILDAGDLAIEPGEHVAIVGRSGAGKSTLVGVLLGWHRPAAGRVLVNGHVLDASTLAQLRSDTAWVDPEVRLWNRSLLENLRYTCTNHTPVSLGEVIDTADLADLLEKLPDGLQSPLGEGGGLASGGEGQRVRFGRAMLRRETRLVILDEPFRGLDRGKRRGLLAAARRVWRETTLLCVTHDVSETTAFDRVLVVEGGRIVEDGSPSDLAARSESRYRSMLDAEESVRTRPWSDRTWRTVSLHDGSVHENDRAAAA